MNIDLKFLNLLKIIAQSIFSILVVRLLLNGLLPFEKSMRPLVIAGYAAFLESGFSRSAVDLSVLQSKSYFKNFLGMIFFVIALAILVIFSVFGWSIYSFFGILMLSTSLINILLYQWQEYIGEARKFQAFALLVYVLGIMVLLYIGFKSEPNPLHIFTVVSLIQISILSRFFFVPAFSFGIFLRFKEIILKNAVWTLLLASTLSIARELAILEQNLVSVEIGIKLGLLLSSFMVSVTFHLYSQIAAGSISDIKLFKIVGFKIVIYVIVLLIFAIFMREIVSQIFATEVDYWTTLKYIVLFSFPTVFDAIMKWVQSDVNVAKTFNLLRFCLMILGIFLFLRGYGGAQYTFWQFVVIPIVAFAYFVIRHDRSTI